ncbi:MAG TPA: PTS sugar transporter subunit IIA [Gemmatimonadaceae bacterium]
MQLTLRQAASYLNVTERTVRRWITARGLPAHPINERLYCNAIELWEWAVENGIPVSKGLLEQARSAPDEIPPLSQLLATGGIHRDVGGNTKPDVLRALVEVLPLPPDVDREFLVTVLEAREAMGSTGIGDGIAIPHVRNPILLHVEHPFVALALLRHPVDFDSLDGQPVHALFAVVSPSVPAHLRILAQLGYTLRDPELRRLLRAAAPSQAILARVAALETSSPSSVAGATTVLTARNG